MAHLPKQRLFRAIYKAGLADERQIEIIKRKVGSDVRAQRAFGNIWREKLGHRFSRTLTAFARWVVEHWDEIKIALGIVTLFLDEEPEKIEDAKGKGVSKGKTKTEAETKAEVKPYVAPPRPKRDAKPVNPWTTANKVGEDE